MLAHIGVSPLYKPHYHPALSLFFSDPLDFRSVETVSHALSASVSVFLLLLRSSPPFQFQIQHSSIQFHSFQSSSTQSMANPAATRFSVLLLLPLFLLSLLVNIAASADSPAPAPHSSADSPSPSHVSPAPNPSPASSPQAPTPAAAPPHPDSPPAPSPETSPSPSPSSSPSPAEADDSGVNHTGVGDLDGESSRGGMSSGKKAGIAVGVIVAAGVVAMGALLYRKRRQNIQRSQYGYAARRELL